MIVEVRTGSEVTLDAEYMEAHPEDGIALTPIDYVEITFGNSGAAGKRMLKTHVLPARAILGVDFGLWGLSQGHLPPYR